MPSPPKALTRLEARLRDGGYEIRYERGHFRAGSCVVHARRVIIVNKFFDHAARLDTLRSIADGLDLSAAPEVAPV